MLHARRALAGQARPNRLEIDGAILRRAIQTCALSYKSGWFLTNDQSSIMGGDRCFRARLELA